MRGLRGNTKGSKKALKNTGRCRFVVDQAHAFPATVNGREEAEAKAIALASRSGGTIRIDLACLRPWEGGEPLKLRALVAKCNPSGCSEPGEGMNGLHGRRKRKKPHRGRRPRGKR